MVALFVAGALPVLWASAAAVGSGLTVTRLTAVPRQAALVQARRPNVIPMRVRDPAEYEHEKEIAERRYANWRQRHGLAATTPAPGPSTAVFDNLNAPGITDAATTGTPSDSTGSIGPSNYVEFINSEIAVYSNTDLSSPTATLGESTFVGDASAFTCDPQVEWDEQGQRWLYAALNCNAATGSEVLYFGWSKTSSPALAASNWCQYSLSTGNSIEDYPKLGHDDSQIIIGTNAFDDRNNNYTASHIFVLDKPANGVTTCPSGTTEGSTMLEATTSASDFTPVPANIVDSSATGYVVAARVSDMSHLDLYAIGRSSGNNTVLSTTAVTVPGFVVPAPVPQPGTSDVLDSSDTRLTQAVAVTNPTTGKEGIWTQHTVAGSGGGPSVVRWYELTPGASTPAQTGTVSGPRGAFAFNGAISPSADGQNAAVFYNSGSGSQLVDWRVQDRHSDTPPGTTIEDLQLATSSFEDSDLSCPSQTASSSSCRWGDYAGASPDPNNACLVWGTSMLTTSSPDVSGTPQWGTQNAAISVCPSTETLSVAKSGGGSGTVTSSPAGIDCGSTCSHSYTFGTTVTLTATPATGSAFSGWSGACSGTGSCSTTMDQARSVTASFTLLPETLSVAKSGGGSGTVTSSPAGIDCGSTCSHSYTFGTTVTLSGTAMKGSSFAGWSGACKGKAPCTVSMTVARSVQASFVKDCYVPKVKGKRLSAAKRAIRAHGCALGKIKHAASKTVKKNYVISQKPKPGRRLKHGAKVKLVVSSGKH
jgi:PASTA domain/Divergent InlB B-repeat domain